MMRLLIVILAILPITILAQELKKIRNQTLFSYEEYYVLKQDKTFKQGKYFKLTQLKMDTLIAGSFDKNIKTGNWRYYETGRLIGRGNFISGKKIGVWEYFEDEVLISKYDHSADSLLYWILPNYKQEVIRDGGSLFAVLSRAPTYPDFYPSIYEKMVYPANAMRMMVSGRVIISFVVNAEGTTEDYKIEKDIGADCGKELLKVLKTLDKGWLPGILDGKLVPVKTVVIADFILLDNSEKVIKVRKYN